MAGDLSDDYVADLLRKDAKAKTKDYSFVGLSALLPKRPTTHAPKPNLKFLRNILRETDSHNTALKEKEENESRTRLKTLSGGKAARESHPGRNYERREEDRPSKRRRLETSDTDHDHDHDRDRRRRRQHGEDQSKRNDCEDRRSRKGKERSRLSGDDCDHDRKDRSENRHRRHRRERAYSVDEDRENARSRHYSRKHKSHSRSRSRSRSKSRREHRKGHRRRHSRSPERRQGEKESRLNGYRDRPGLAADHQSDSDPLEAIVGPLPAPPSPQPQRRGRGAYTSSSAMDARFSASYDPSTNVQPNSGDDQDDWGLALERLRDRAKWKALGAERLKAAGFSDAETKRWENSGTGKEKGEEDVTWAKKGEGREWDRGKVMDSETGDVELRAEWARLK